MPRGYLKHNRGVSKKKARGGASRHWTNVNNEGTLITRRNDIKTLDEVFDDIVLAPSTYYTAKRNTTTCLEDHGTSTTKYPIRECAICFNKRPTITLSKKCWHHAACKECLRKLYVHNTWGSYPLKCFNPCCDQSVHAAQLEKHNIFSSTSEVRSYHEKLIQAKINKNKGLRTVMCPKCEAPRGIKKFNSDKDHIFGCVNPECRTRYYVSPFYATLRCLDNLKSDKMGINDGWARCPQCEILISKGDGCEHMDCVYCGKFFLWDEAIEKKMNRVPHAKIPDSEIYLWW